MNNNALISVIMPVYNAETSVGIAIISILNQTYKKLEILIADDASNDGTWDLLKSFDDNRIRLFRNSENIGYLQTCNMLFKESKGDFIAFQDADDYSFPDRLEKLLSVMLENSDIALCGCNFIRKNSTTGVVQIESNYPLLYKDIIEYIYKNRTLPICGPSVIVRKSVYESIGGYRSFYSRIGYEHFDWFFLILEKWQIANINDVLYQYNYTPGSFSRIGTLDNYIKFHIVEIAWFLKMQREKYGTDALMNSKIEDEFNQYLSKLEKDFQFNRFPVYKKVIFNNLSNENTKDSIIILKMGRMRNEITIIQALYFYLRILRTKVKIIILNRWI